MHASDDLPYTQKGYVPSCDVTVHDLMPGPYGRRIAAARDYAGLSREQLATLLEVHPATVGRYERGEGPPPKRPVRQAIARCCGVPEWFIEDGFPANQP